MKIRYQEFVIFSFSNIYNYYKKIWEEKLSNKKISVFL